MNSIQFKQRFASLHLTRTLGLVLFIFAAVIGLLGFLNQHTVFVADPLIEDFYANISAELASIAFTILIIDYLNERREKSNLKERLIREMQTRDNGAANRAVRELMAHGWHKDGSLHGQFLNYANLENVYLRDTDFKEARLHRASFRNAWMRGVNLTGANLTASDFTNVHRFTPRQLMAANKLVGSKMPDGNRYDGRFNRPGDFKLALQNGHDVNDPSSMARFYRVPMDVYQYWQDNPMTKLDMDWEKIVEKELGEVKRPYYPDSTPSKSKEDSSQNIPRSETHLMIWGAVIALVSSFLTILLTNLQKTKC